MVVDGFKAGVRGGRAGDRDRDRDRDRAGNASAAREESPDDLDFEVVPLQSGATPSRPARAYAGVIVSGSSAMVTERHAWAERARAWLADAIARGENPPILGVCFGHQLLADALGGRVDWCGRRNLGTIDVGLEEAACAEDELFRFMVADAGAEVGAKPRTLSGIAANATRGSGSGAAVASPSPPPSPDSEPDSPRRVIQVQVAHRQCVHRLPERAVPLARDADGRVYAARLAPRVWGLQYHPEMTRAVVRAIMDFQRATLEGEGWNVDERKRAVRDAPMGAALLARFGDVCVAWGERAGSRSARL